MRKFLITVALVAVAIPAFAQQPSPPASRDAKTPAVNTPNSPPNPACVGRNCRQARTAFQDAPNAF